VGRWSWLVYAFIAALAVLWLLPNLPPVAGFSTHTILKHGTEAENAVWEWQNGACVAVGLSQHGLEAVAVGGGVWAVSLRDHSERGWRGDNGLHGDSGILGA
jgi:hypothetical protein